jgi:hypothetical protein
VWKGFGGEGGWKGEGGRGIQSKKRCMRWTLRATAGGGGALYLSFGITLLNRGKRDLL